MDCASFATRLAQLQIPPPPLLAERALASAPQYSGSLHPELEALLPAGPSGFLGAPDVAVQAAVELEESVQTAWAASVEFLVVAATAWAFACVFLGLDHTVLEES